MDESAASYKIGSRRGPNAGPSPSNALGALKLGLSTILIGLAAVLLCLLLAGFAMGVLVGVTGREGASDFITQIKFDMGLRTKIGAVTMSALYLSLATATLIMARVLGGSGWRDLVAVVPIKPGRGRTLMLALATLAYAAAITFAIQLKQGHHLQDAGPTDVVLLVTLLANVCVLAPLAEELFFRGWLYTALRSKLSFWPSYLVTALLFAAIHWLASVAHMLKVLPLAAVLGLVRQWKASVKPTIALHAAYNLTIVLITLATS